MHGVTLLDAPPAAVALATLLGSISRRCWQAGWLDDIEFAAWGWATCAQDAPFEFGDGEVTREEATALQVMSLACDGWVTWKDVEHSDPIKSYLQSGPHYVPLEEWKRVVAERDDEEREAKRLRAILMNA